jgi:hypothetical protein
VTHGAVETPVVPRPQPQGVASPFEGVTRRRRLEAAIELSPAIVPETPKQSRRDDDFGRQDKVLAELMTEMIELREEVTDLRSQLTTLSAEKPARRSAAPAGERTRKRQQISPA